MRRMADTLAARLARLTVHLVPAVTSLTGITS